MRPLAFEFRRFDSGDLLHRIPLGEAHERAHGAPYLQIHRSDLHRALHQAVAALDPAAIVLGARAKAITEAADAVTVHFDGDRPPATAELLVGADGIKSVVRRHVVGADAPRFTGQVAWRCLVPIERIAPALRTPIVSTIWCGPKNHAVMYYLRRGELLNFVGCVERPDEEESWTARRPWAELDEDYRGWHPMVRAVIDSVDRDQCFRWALNNRAPTLDWSRARCTLLGDAVHATLPYMAQGAAMAIEDAAVLARCLEGVERAGIAPALRRYEANRQERTARMQLTSRQNAWGKGATDTDWVYSYNAWTAPLA